MSWKLFKFDNWLTQFLKWLISRLRLTIDEISQNRLTHHDCNTMLNNFEDKLENWNFEMKINDFWDHHEQILMWKLTNSRWEGWVGESIIFNELKILLTKLLSV